jgi:hypothetical protein
LEEGVWGRNLAKVSPQLARPHQTLTHPWPRRHTENTSTLFRSGDKQHTRTRAFTKERRLKIARKAAAARWGKKT